MNTSLKVNTITIEADGRLISIPCFGEVTISIERQPEGVDALGRVLPDAFRIEGWCDSISDLTGLQGAKASDGRTWETCAPYEEILPHEEVLAQIEEEMNAFYEKQFRAFEDRLKKRMEGS